MIGYKIGRRKEIDMHVRLEFLARARDMVK
jgi:hypothetical protein